MEVSEEQFKQQAAKLLKYMMGRLKLQSPPEKLILKKDEENANDLFGKTGYYNPNDKSITIFVTGRHPKDQLRSFAHEVIHFWQDINGKLNLSGYTGAGYAQKNKELRQCEKAAFLFGNMIFRDFCDLTLNK